MLNYENYINALNSIKVLEEDNKNNRLAHTYLLENGDMDLGFCYAKKMTKIILNLVGLSPASFQVDKNVHPDVKIYGDKIKFNSEMASEIVSDVLVMPYEGERKVYILLNADDINEEAQNKLLKTLEEPPASAYFILVCRSEKTLLQTIISRCKKIIIKNPTEEEIAEMLSRVSDDKNKINTVSVCAAGNASKALKMLESPSFIKLYDNVFEMFRTMNSSRDILPFVAKFSTKDFLVQDFLTITESVAMDIIYLLSKAESLIQNKHKTNELKIIATMFSIPALVKILKECFDFRESLYYNVNTTIGLDEFLLKFVEVKVKCKR